MKVRTLIIINLIIGLLSFYGCDINSTDSNNSDIKVIEITDDLNYVDDSAVWFSPSTGEIVETGNGEIPPAPKYTYWVDPGDPEFSTRIDTEEEGIYGIIFIGIGSNYFEETTSTESGGFNENLFSVGSFETNSVFFIREENVDCLIQILDWEQSENYLKFKW
ncbi:MAG: hypothetical protein HQ562_10390 [Candidatus Marinimicrobia bacterium]|nr:hypothetical protein [Candidatus Neomarinimicrobiota bacterium]